MRRALITALLCSSVAAVPAAQRRPDPYAACFADDGPGAGIVAIVAADDRNRGLEITAESNGYMRSSHIQLDGRDAQRVWDIEFRDVPKGNYDVVGILTGTDGRRATVSRLVVIMPLH